MFFQSKKVLGLDVGSTSIKVAELDVSRNGAVLNNFVIAPTPAQAVVNGDIADPSAIAETLSGLFQSFGSKRKRVATAISGNSVIVKKVSIPPMDENMVGEQIKWEAEQYIPFDINETNLDFRILKTSSAPENMDVLIVAAKQDSIFRYTEIMESIGKSLAIVDVAGFSLANCFEKNYEVTNNSAVALVDVGGFVSSVTVLDRGEIVFSRDIMLGGSNYTSEIQKGMGLTFEEAEAMKISATQGQAVPEDLTRILNQGHQPLAEEIHGSLEFFHNSTPGATIGACYVTGGGARVTGFFQHLSQVVKIKAQPLDPFRNVRPNKNQLSPSFITQISDVCAVAIGLGLRSAGDS